MIKCNACESELTAVKVELSNSTIVDPRFHFFYQCFSCGYSDKKWVSTKIFPEIRKGAVPFNEDLYDEYLSRKFKVIEQAGFGWG